ncbi:lipoprotein [Spiroplasma culicicola]|uniref:Lipoprotein n=1 Tax=Spiroplasma culicicola AES-1 TaxID=1276246 RepID=W6A7Y2_9MOLU|nr:lipoprotein [Spiroplasma culicicola]AHI52995.1 hypothetical protein SCULI_v1c06540 [Spiroplasma culicicola AES-1]
MKKLISLLGSLSLVATSSVTVLACSSGPKDNNGDDNTSEINKLIEEFLKDLNLTTDNYWKEINNNFFDVTTNSNSLFTFLNQKTITDLVDKNQGEAVKGDVLSESDKKYLVSDINKIMASDKMKKYFEDNINKEKYALIIEGLDFYSGFEPDWSSLEINYTNDNILKDESESNFISYVSLNLNLKFKYFDSNNQETEYSLLKRFIFTLTSNEILVDSIQNLEKNITNDYYLKGGDYSWIDANNFGYENKKDLANIFTPTNIEFKKIYEDNPNFKNNIIDFMKINYFKEISTVPLAFTGDIIFDQYISNDYLKAEAAVESNWANEADLKLYNSIFSKLEKNQTGFLFDEESSLNSDLYNYLNNNYIRYYNSYNSRNKSVLEQMETELDEQLVESKQIAFENSISNGEVKLKGLSIEVNNSYIHPINDLSIFISIAISNDETKEIREDYRKSYLFGAMYYNLELGIEAFQNVFDIKTREEKSYNKLPVARFSGQGISSSGELDNIWNDISVSGHQFPTMLNDSISLKNKNLIKHRDVLLEQGKQNIYNWSITANTNTMMKVTDTGVINDGWYYSGDSNITWNFRQNFINVNFKIENVWRTRNLTIIEKAQKD